MPLGHIHIQLPLSDWTIIYFASMLANSVISSTLALRSSCTLNPCLQHPCLCVWSVYTRYIIKFIFDVPLYTWFHSTFYICIPESGLTLLQDTATPVTIDNDASIQQTATVKNIKPGI
jgi:hypothetical protein